MKPGLKPGVVGSASFVVTDAQLVPALFGGTAFPAMPAVLATAQMVGLMEWGAVEALRPFYEEGEDSLGIHVDFDHSAPTLPGQTVTVTAEVTRVDGRIVDFRIEAHDGVDRIGGGAHRRAVIDTARFAQKLATKRAALEG